VEILISTGANLLKKRADDSRARIKIISAVARHIAKAKINKIIIKRIRKKENLSYG